MNVNINMLSTALMRNSLANRRRRHKLDGTFVCRRIRDPCGLWAASFQSFLNQRRIRGHQVRGQCAPSVRYSIQLQ